MPDLNLLAVLVATVVVFVLGATYYAVLGEQLATVTDAAETSPSAAEPGQARRR